ncbi:MAG: 3-beta hydroxysteroid dehydrogenase [Flavobacteriaceae bacterium]|nr:3-beta hydroxysteroid dehydrogenase [Flavobacteriaceae bacterium]|tara:strand:+ start:704 stop:1678 length:975 start_codon:yes stop_codon:yes gene_type:complete
MSGQVLVTGATGFLGRAVVMRLGSKGIGQGRDSERLEEIRKLGIPAVRWNLPDRAPPDPLLNNISAIVHCAGLSAPFGPRQAFLKANVLGTKAVLDFARRQAVSRLVFISSPSIYFTLADQLNVNEDMTLPLPFNAYAESKVLAERLVRSANEIDSIILRPRGIYGPDDNALLPRLLRIAQARALPRLRKGRARIDLTFVEDVVDAVLAALGTGPANRHQVFNISGGEAIPIQHIAEEVCKRAGIHLRWRDTPLGPAMFVARALEIVARCRPQQPEPMVTRYALGLFAFEQSLDITRVQNTLGWSPKVCFSDGLDLTFSMRKRT